MRQLFWLALVMFWGPACDTSQPSFDIVLEGGRVIDPELGLDGIRNIGIRDDSVAIISTTPLRGTRMINARGLVVAPGFIELHQHAHDDQAYRVSALDGVTMMLELEHGVPDIQRFIEVRRGRTPIHYGAAASHRAARISAWDIPFSPSRDGPEAALPPPSHGPVTSEPASVDKLNRMLEALRAQLDAGALGIGMGLEFFPGTSRYEVIEVFRLAAKQRVPVFVHARSAGANEPGSGIESVGELIGAAAISGASLHLVHVNSTCLAQSPLCLSMIVGARARGLDITTEAYPYTAGMTPINSPFFNPGWRERRGIDYGDLEFPGTGERLTKQRFDELRAADEPVRVLIHMNPESVVDSILADPMVMIAADGLAAHPRGAGAHARVLARYVRERKIITLPEAIRRMTLMPAERLEGMVPNARRLGRLQPGSRADIVVFDAQTIQDEATFSKPRAPSVGVRYLLVAGTVVVNDGSFVEETAPGRPVIGHTSAQR